MKATVLLFPSFMQTLAWCFNLDFEYAVLKTGPEGSLFGFSVAEHQENNNGWIIAGAPKAVNRYLQISGSKDNSSGTVFKCNASDASFNCTEEIKFDINPSTKSESKTNAWLGVSLKSQGKDKSVMSCAHRYEYYGQFQNFRLLEGQCFQIDSTLQYEETYYNPCRKYNNDRSTTPNHESYGQCQGGLGLEIYSEHDGDDNTHVIIGSVGAKDWSGALFEADSDGRQNEVPLVEDDVYDDSYLGYNIALGKYYTSSSQLDIAAGGPRHGSYGTVFVYRSKAQSIFQQIPKKGSNDEIQIASGFGISLCAIDANNDGSYDIILVIGDFNAELENTVLQVFMKALSLHNHIMEINKCLDELVVGAPFYSLEGRRDRPDNGVVYIYYQPEGQDELYLQQELVGQKSYSQFGYAVANAGDLNLDSYNDLVVGAPRENDGAGAVYLFQGSNVGIFKKPSQHIAASTVHSGLVDNIGLKGFGRSIATGLDMDNNGYNDVLIGAFISNQVILLRSRPVIHISSNMQFSPTEIDISNKECLIKDIKTNCFRMRFCHNFSEPSHVLDIKEKTVRVKYTIIADPIRKPRVHFAQTHTNEHTFYVDSSFKTKCEEIKNLYLVFNQNGAIGEYPDLTFIVRHDLPYGEGIGEIPKPARSGVLVPSLDEYPILTRQFEDGGVSSKRSIDIKLKFKRECITCIPDMSIASKASNYTLLLGGKTFRFNVTIRNSGVDPAFSVGLKFILPVSLELHHVLDGKNERIICQRDYCENIFDKFLENRTEKIGIVLNTRNFEPSSINNISVYVTSVNEENGDTAADNMINIKFDIQVVADIQLFAAVSTQQVLYQGSIKGASAMTSLQAAGKDVEHKYAVRNNGPNLLPKANVTIYWPYETLSGKHLLYLVSVTHSSQNVKCILPKDTNFLNLKSDGTGNSYPLVDGEIMSPSIVQTQLNKRKRRNVSNVTHTASTQSITPTNKVVENEKDGLILGCIEGTAKCVSITCTVTNLASEESVFMSINSRLWEASLLMDYYGEVLTIVSHGVVEIGTNVSYITDPNLDNNESELYTVINPVFAAKGKDSGVQEWQIALAIVAGCLLLALLIFGLYKVGFFKRRRTGSILDKKKETNRSLLAKK